MADVKPNNTLYINNLNEKVKKEGECGLDLLHYSPYSPIHSHIQS